MLTETFNKHLQLKLEKIIKPDNPARDRLVKITMAAKEKDQVELAKARELSHIPWCEEYEKMISGMLYEQSYSLTRPMSDENLPDTMRSPPTSKPHASKREPGHTNTTTTSPPQKPIQTLTR
jgi:hypothetical protein